MEHSLPQTITDPVDVEAFLTQHELELEKLIAAGHHALASSATASPLHPSNAAGMFSYLDGVKGLRLENMSGNWEIFKKDGVEGIQNHALKIRVLYANVNQACAIESPKPRSKKGAGSERIAGGNLFDSAGIDLPLTRLKMKGDYKTYYLMVDPSGAMELSLPIVKNGQFLKCIERVFLIEGGDLNVSFEELDEPITEHDLDVIISRK